jgi:pyridoxine 5-phosphate synthase
MTRLSVNVNKLATLRNSRGKNTPDVAALGRKILHYGAQGLTVHPRPDGRHIRTPDVWALRKICAEAKVEFNVEGYPSAEFLQLVASVRPAQATLVPDPPEALTSNAGWNLESAERQLTDVLATLRAAGIRSSLFIDPKTFTRFQGESLVRLKPDRVELYTERYADSYPEPSQREKVIAEYRLSAEFAQKNGIGVNAGHDLNQENLGYLVKRIPWIDEVSIGHALIAEALEEGLAKTIAAYLKILKEAGDAVDSHSRRA